MTRAVTVGVLFGEGSGMEEVDDDVDGLMLEMVVVVVCCLPSPSLLLVSFSVVLLDCIDITEGLTVLRSFSKIEREKWFRGTFRP